MCWDGTSNTRDSIYNADNNSHLIILSFLYLLVISGTNRCEEYLTPVKWDRIKILSHLKDVI